MIETLVLVVIGVVVGIVGAGLIVSLAMVLGFARAAARAQSGDVELISENELERFNDE